MNKLSLWIVLVTILTGCGVPDGAVPLDSMGDDYYFEIDQESTYYSGNVVFNQNHSDWSNISYHYKSVSGNPKYDFTPKLITTFTADNYDCEEAKQNPKTKVWEAPKEANHVGESISFAQARCMLGALHIDVYWKNINEDQYSGIIYDIDIVGLEGKEFELNFHPHPAALSLVRKNERAEE